MIPRTLSASSILVSEGCMERWKVEYNDRAPRTSGTAANVGTSCHYALEKFVELVYIKKQAKWEDVSILKAFYDIGYTETFGNSDFESPEYADGAKLVADWYDRNKDGLKDTVLSTEVKKTFDIKTSIGVIPFTYILDRADQIGPNEYAVVDYKTLRGIVNSDDLKRKIQPRAYALATQIEFPNAEKIWVSFDMLRHEGPVGAVFTKEENAATYRYLQRAAERIIAADAAKVRATINDECKWCLKKTTCETLQKSADAGSVHALDLNSLLARKVEVTNALSALKYAQEELDKEIVKEAEVRDAFEFTEGEYEVKITSRSTRKPNSAAIAHIVGPELVEEYGNFTMTNVTKMLKVAELSDQQRAQINQHIDKTWSEPTPKVKHLKEF